MEHHESRQKLNYTVWTTSGQEQTITVVARVYDPSGVIEEKSKQVDVPAGETANVTIEMDMPHTVDETLPFVRGCERADFPSDSGSH